MNLNHLKTIRQIESSIFINTASLVSLNLISEDYKRQLESRVKNGKKIPFTLINDPESPKETLIDYSSLSNHKKEVVKSSICGGLTPENYLKHHHIKGMLTLNDTDRICLAALEDPQTGKLLSVELQEKYTNVAKYIYLLSCTTPRDAKEFGYKTLKDFYEAVSLIALSEGVKIPTNYKKLRERVKAYRTEGVKSLLSKHVFNKRSQKVTPQSKAIFTEIYGKHQQLKYTQTTKLYNQLANELGLKEICPKTVKNWVPQMEITGSREGLTQLRNKFDLVIHRERPSRPNLLWVIDSTTYDLYYQTALYDKQGHLIRNHWNRKTICLVVDAYNDYVVGYALGNQENSELITEALRNACRNQQTFPNQLKTDNFGKNELKNVFTNIALHYTPSEVGNARDKVVEAVFGRLYNEVTRFRKNASGRNVTAKEKPNKEYLRKIATQFPDEDKVVEQIHEDIFLWNNKPRDRYNGKSLEQIYMEGDHTKNRELTQSLYLRYLGVKHNYLNEYTNRGLELTINGVSKCFRGLDMKITSTIGTKYQAYYDPENLEGIYIEDQTGTLQFIIPADVKEKMALADYKQGDRTRLNEKLTHKNEVKNYILDKQKERQEVLIEMDVANRINEFNHAESIIQIQPIEKGQQKGMLNRAEDTLKQLTVPKVVFVEQAIKEPESAVNESYGIFGHNIDTNFEQLPE